jgi:hypothetical protein
MPAPPPRLVPTVVLAALWVALYLLYLSVKPEPPVSDGRDGRATTTTSVTSPAEGDRELSRPVVRAPVPDRTG